MSSNDELILEDEVQRVTLTGNIPSRELVTGVVVALLGRDLHDGSFDVQEYCFTGGSETVEVQSTEDDAMDTEDKETK